MTQKEKRPKYVITSIEILALGIKKIPMLVEKLLQKIGLASLSGSSDSGKSFLALFIATIICGKYLDLFGLKVNREFGSVIMVCSEDSAEDMCVRLTAFLGNKEKTNENLRFIFDTGNLPTKLRKELKRQPADLVIVDTFGDLFRGNINDSIAIRQYLQPFKRMATEFRCLFIFNHHIGKGKERNTSPDKSDVLGSQGIESACRTVLMLKKMPDGKRILTVVKGDHIAEEHKNKGIVLSFNIEKGFEITGETMNFSESTQKTEVTKSLIEEVLLLYPQLKSYQKVATALKAKGYKIEKNKVGKIWNEYNPSVSSPNENDGRTDEKSEIIIYHTKNYNYDLES